MYINELETERQCQAAKGVTFNLKDFSAKRCLEQFRFTTDKIYLLCNLLRIPDPILCETCIHVSASFGLCLVWKRLEYPCRFCDLTLLFGQSPLLLSLIFKHVPNHINDNFRQKLSSLDQTWINPRLFAGVIAKKGAPLKNCCGFTDGTAREMDQP